MEIGLSQLENEYSKCVTELKEFKKRNGDLEFKLKDQNNEIQELKKLIMEMKENKNV